MVYGLKGGASILWGTMKHKELLYMLHTFTSTALYNPLSSALPRLLPNRPRIRHLRVLPGLPHSPQEIVLLDLSPPRRPHRARQSFSCLQRFSPLSFSHTSREVNRLFFERYLNCVRGTARAGLQRASGFGGQAALLFGFRFGDE